eukprot:TRINITY_DN549_c0_g1_i1.p1 TRINITY_DN549_c0_g1~~TRINITY_DN549_c0_g1_i1.p1  ORF type:complete len:388 (+),score=84.69 TRINITY_DN549_c0_g1_i1:125-1288(+)
MESAVRRTSIIASHLMQSKREVGVASSPVAATSSVKSDLKDFVEIFPLLQDEILRELPLMGIPPAQQDWIRKLLEVNVQGGKMNRGLTVIHSLQYLCEGRSLTRTEVFKALVLGWCVEWLQAFFLVADDIMDQSLTRRGQPCWYRQKHPLSSNPDDKIGNIAINDSFILEACIYRIVKKYFKHEAYYGELLDLFLETSYQTEIGQLLDLTTVPPGGIGDLSAFTLDNYKRIVKYKTAYYSFYLPVALAMMMSGITSQPAYDVAKEILLAMGEYFQIQDDFLDCYGDPAVIGKVGRDIEENKCGWLIIQALARADATQRMQLQQHYGKDNPADVAVVKKIFNEINLPEVFRKYEEESYQSLLAKIKKVRIIPQEVFLTLLAKIYKRSL